MKTVNSHIPSIFNDVVGPVMRGPSSSHSAAALRIGLICRELMQGTPGRVVVSYDTRDALATTHESQGSDMGMKGGLLGFEPDDVHLLDPDPYLEEAGIDLSFRVTDTGYDLPNLYLVHLQKGDLKMEVAALSTGGGMIEIIRINNAQLSIKGDRKEELWFSATGELILQGPPPEGAVKRVISPLLPTGSRDPVEVPFSNCRQMMQYNSKRDLSAWELAAVYESMRGGVEAEEVFHKMQELCRVMRGAIDTGLKGTRFKDRILGAQSAGYLKRLKAGGLAGGEAVHNITLYVSAIMEVKSSMGTIVAAPTAGSCGTFPGAVIGVADSLGLDEEQVVKALLAGSLTGLFIATASTFSAEIGGCQAECGSGSGMAAAAIAWMLGGSVEQCMAASSLALQNSLGMICDPIAARVEAPCLGRNISSAVNALISANIALAGYDHLIPLDEVIETMDRVGRSLPRELRCTALGGLAITPAAKKIERSLKSQKSKGRC
ncbi:MAG: L-serine ammonia-lyase, iron-sulfur-dependent, subunit alpha [Bacteroidales bacterium]|nr:L-serine ammonia-lyase, iron-sulfur-dependent, subunit alpha [Bacteroidales bacterium]